MTSSDKSPFDAFAEDYDQALQRGLSVSGENREFYARGRVAFLASCLAEQNARPRKVMDFGCGTGGSTPFLVNLSEDCFVTGAEESEKSIETARRTYGSLCAEFILVKDYKPAGDFDLVFCNGVFHHIPREDRAEVVNFIFRSLHYGGWFAFWENNPWNPGTRYVMYRIPFDRGAIKVAYREARRLLQAGGFEVIRTDFRFFFPHSLRWLRHLENRLIHFPFGAQYQVLCRKPYPPEVKQVNTV